VSGTVTLGLVGVCVWHSGTRIGWFCVWHSGTGIAWVLCLAQWHCDRFGFMFGTVALGYVGFFWLAQWHWNILFCVWHSGTGICWFFVFGAVALGYVGFLCLAQWHWDRFSFEYFGSTPPQCHSNREPYSFNHSFIFIYVFTNSSPSLCNLSAVSVFKQHTCNITFVAIRWVVCEIVHLIFICP